METEEERTKIKGAARRHGWRSGQVGGTGQGWMRVAKTGIGFGHLPDCRHCLNSIIIIISSPAERANALGIRYGIDSNKQDMTAPRREKLGGFDTRACSPIIRLPKAVTRRKTNHHTCL